MHLQWYEHGYSPLGTDQQLEELELKRLASCTRARATMSSHCFFRVWTSVRLTQHNPSLGALRLLNTSPHAAVRSQRSEARVIR